MAVSFNEKANVFISDNLTIEQRKKLWSDAVSLKLMRLVINGF